MDLEVLPQGNQNVVRLLQVAGRGELEVVQGEGDGQVEAVVGGFVDDDEAVFLGRELREVDVVFGGGEEVALLADFGLEGRFVEELEEVDVGRVRLEMLFQQHVDGGFEHEGVVDGDHAHGGLAVPAGSATARHAGVHYVVRYQEEGLQEFGEPAQDGGLFIVVWGERVGGEDGGSVDYGEAAVAFSAGGVVFERLWVRDGGLACGEW